MDDEFAKGPWLEEAQRLLLAFEQEEDTTVLALILTSLRRGAEMAAVIPLPPVKSAID